MKFPIFNKIILLIVIFGLVFSPLGSVFVPKAKAQYGPSTPGAAVGQALAMGAACFLEAKLESILASAITALLGTLGLTPIADQAEIQYKAYTIFAPAAVLVPWSVPALTMSATEAIETAKQQTSDALLRSKDCIRDVVVKMIIDWLVDETVAWIQGEGQPRYVTNWGSFLSDAFNVGVGEIINQTDAAFLCEPFGLQLRLALLPVQRFQNRITCTLDDITANINDFYNDFRNGGWLAYEEQWWPENNYYGALYMAMDEIMTEGMRQREAAEKEAMASKGFLSVKECAPGTSTEDSQLAAEMHLQKDIRGNYCMPEDMIIVTPGDVVGETVAAAVTSDYSWAANVRSWVAAIVNAAINRLFKEGLGLMRPSTASRPKGYGGDYDTGVLKAQMASLAPQLQEEYGRIIEDYQNIRDYFTAILTNKKQSLSSEEQILVLLNEIKQRNCQPSVTDVDIAAAQNEVMRLTDDVAYYQAAIDEANTNITQAQTIQNFTDREIALLNQNYNDFVYKYSSLISEISWASENIPESVAASVPKTTKQITLEESQAKQNELSAAQSRLAICIATTP